jgi:O-acetyl-ADP-ribose deacetylase (regulator of RNase III)
MKAKINKVTIQITQAEIFALPVAGVVLESDTDLVLSPAVLSRTGLSVQRELVEIGYCEVGSAVITSAGNLPVEKLIHVVGPRWGEGSERGKLANATFECLRLAETNHLKSIAFPPISTGAMGYPLENCATTMLSHIVDFTFEELRHLRGVIICLNDKLPYEVFCREFQTQLDLLKEDGSAKVQQVQV